MVASFGERAKGDNSHDGGFKATPHGPDHPTVTTPSQSTPPLIFCRLRFRARVLLPDTNYASNTVAHTAPPSRCTGSRTVLALAFTSEAAPILIRGCADCFEDPAGLDNRMDAVGEMPVHDEFREIPGQQWGNLKAQGRGEDLDMAMGGHIRT
ncbi:hypothetical protein MSAN_00104900 [Mycena sanguinolenta]|uniref:Uncharacterized protein n=1 Tax=Mycena sanguinolenta TaxID=230812 RepID=A0A8H7DLM6_9AGAR|nr:hypothetical protein MSAN_00104900 [Mycena sanguinolenta]